MEEYQKRLMDEYKDLLIKIGKANAYLKDHEDQLLSEQVKYMQSYANIVKVRLGICLVDKKLIEDNGTEDNKD